MGVFNSAVFPGLVIKDWPLSLDMYATYSQNQRSFEEFGVWIPGAAGLTGAGDPEQVTTVAMTHGVLRALGVKSYLGRWFSSADDMQTMRRFIPEAQIICIAQANQDIALPLEFEYHNGNPVSVEGKTPVDRMPPNRTIKQISPGLFAALRTRLIAGRDFTWDDLLSKRRVAIVSENMARENWAEPRDALGKGIRINGDEQWSIIVGVAENVYDDGVDREPPTLVYFPGSRRGVTFAIRSSRAGTQSLLKEIGTKLHAVDPGVPMAQVRTLGDLYRFTMARRSFVLALLGIAAAMAVTLSVIGVYGVLAYAVAQRGREISIRLAIGAEPAAIKLLFLRRGLLLMSIGAAIGLVAARELSRWMAALLFGVQPFDVLTYGTAAVVILSAALAASYVPARRAASLNPVEGLRAE